MSVCVCVYECVCVCVVERGQFVQSVGRFIQMGTCDSELLDH